MKFQDETPDQKTDSFHHVDIVDIFEANDNKSLPVSLKKDKPDENYQIQSCRYQMDKREQTLSKINKMFQKKKNP